MRLLFVGVFDRFRKSTNTSQLFCFKRLGIDVVGYNYRMNESNLGAAGRDEQLLSVIKEDNFDMILFSKCNGVSLECFREASKRSTAVLWWMDPLSTFMGLPEMKDKIKVSDYVITAVKNTVPVFKEYNANVHYVSEGFDADVDKPHQLPKDIDVVFIGSLHGNRGELIRQINRPVTHVTNAYGIEHARTVSRAKICLNFATAGATSDRVYKTLAAGGFILSSDWASREEDFADKEDLVIFADIADLNSKIDFYLNNDEKRDTISQAGCRKVQRFNRSAWAENILNICKKELL
jgi:hypothetical protein